MTIHIHKLFDKMEYLTLEVEKSTTIRMVKLMVKSHWKIAIKHQKIQKNGGLPLCDDDTLDNAEISDGQTLELVLILFVNVSFLFHFISFSFRYVSLSSWCLRFVIFWRPSISTFFALWNFTNWNAHVCLKCLKHWTCKFEFELVNHNFLNF